MDKQLRSLSLGIIAGILLGFGFVFSNHNDNTNLLTEPNISFYNEIGSFDFSIEIDDYFDYRRKRNIPEKNKDYIDYVTYEDSNIKDLAKVLTEFSETNEYKALDLLYLVQLYGIYTSDKEFYPNYVRYPVETLVEGTGDCEDASLLYASLAKAVGLDIVLISCKEKKEVDPSGHMVVGVVGDFEGKYVSYDGKDYFFADPTFCPVRYNCGISDVGEFLGDVDDWDFKVIPID